MWHTMSVVLAWPQIKHEKVLKFGAIEIREHLKNIPKIQRDAKKEGAVITAIIISREES